VLRATAGSLTLNDGTAAADNTAISAHGSGNILLQAIAALTSVTANADVVTATGNITILAAQNVTFTAGADILTAGAGSTGTINVGGGLARQRRHDRPVDHFQHDQHQTATSGCGPRPTSRSAG